MVPETWSLQDAKNRFSAVVDAALAGRPQLETLHQPSLSELLLAMGAMLLLDTMVLSELRKRNRNPAVVAWFRPRILPINTAIAQRWGRLSAEIGHPGADLMLAATALEHGMHVVTRNERHVLPIGHEARCHHNGEFHQEVAADIAHCSAAAMAWLKARRSGSFCRIARTAEESIPIRRGDP